MDSKPPILDQGIKPEPENLMVVASTLSNRILMFSMGLLFTIGVGFICNSIFEEQKYTLPGDIGMAAICVLFGSPIALVFFYQSLSRSMTVNGEMKTLVRRVGWPPKYGTTVTFAFSDYKSVFIIKTGSRIKCNIFLRSHNPDASFLAISTSSWSQYENIQIATKIAEITGLPYEGAINIDDVYKPQSAPVPIVSRKR
jgi:hypothetical protein